jgi:hypothetical protein
MVGKLMELRAIQYHMDFICNDGIYFEAKPLVSPPRVPLLYTLAKLFPCIVFSSDLISLFVDYWDISFVFGNLEALIMLHTMKYIRRFGVITSCWRWWRLWCCWILKARLVVTFFGRTSVIVLSSLTIFHEVVLE